MSCSNPVKSRSPGFTRRLWFPPAFPVVSSPSLRAEYDDRNHPPRTPRSTRVRDDVATPSASKYPLASSPRRCGSSTISTCGANTAVPSRSSRNEDWR